MNTRAALVTGGSRGIGRACALALAARGHRVVVNYARDADAARDVVQEIRTRGGEGIAIQADVGDMESNVGLYRAAVAAFGQIDVLVCNAGVAPTTAIEDIDAAEWAHVLDVNARSVLFLARTALADMRGRQWGRIITIASQAGLTGGFFVGAHYAASKGAVIALTRALAKRGAAFGVTANCVAPGLIDTDMTRAFDAAQRDRMIAAIPTKRMGDAADVGSAVAFLASEDASYINGVILPVDGGLLAG